MNASVTKRIYSWHGIRILIAVVLGSSTLNIACHAEDTKTTQIFEEGNRAYAAGDFTQAIDRYQE